MAATHTDIPMRKRTWYGPTAVIEIHDRSLHRAGFGKMLIPHPPAVNWLLRLGLANEPYLKLSAIHEFGHFQVLPFIALYTIGIGIWIFMAHISSFFGIIAILVSIHATWEMLAEWYVRFNSGRRYSTYYKGIAVFPRIIFWSVAAAISIGGWVMLLY